MKLIGLLVLLALVSLVEGEVVDSFAYFCPDFFIKDQKNGFFNGFFNLFSNNNNPVIPTVLVYKKRDRDGKPLPRYKQICQRYNNKYRYATLYDTLNRIPVWSAYLYTGYTQLDRSKTWRIEPQLDGLNGKDMTTKAKAGGPVGKHQAVNGDYKNSGYQRGHVYPHCHNCKTDQSDSTFTLTNAAPQTGADNTQWFNNVENVVNKDISEKCSQNSAHVVTGVVPGKTFMKRRINNVDVDRVNIPSHFWTAFCCSDKKNQNSLISEGFVLEMTGKGDRKASRMSLDVLNQKLEQEYNEAFLVFGNVKGCSKSSSTEL